MSATTSFAQWLPKRERRSAGAADAWRRACRERCIFTVLFFYKIKLSYGGPYQVLSWLLPIKSHCCPP